MFPTELINTVAVKDAEAGALIRVPRHPAPMLVGRTAAGNRLVALEGERAFHVSQMSRVGDSALSFSGIRFEVDLSSAARVLPSDESVGTLIIRDGRRYLFTADDEGYGMDLSVMALGDYESSDIGDRTGVAFTRWRIVAGRSMDESIVLFELASATEGR